MWNPLRWLRRRRDEEVLDASDVIPEADGPNLNDLADALDAQRELLDSVRDRLDERLTNVEKERKAWDDRLIGAVRELQRITLRVESNVQSRLDRLGGDLNTLRDEVHSRLEKVECALTEVGAQSAKSAKRADEIVGRTDLLDQRIGRMAASFEEQFHKTDASLAMLRRESTLELNELRAQQERALDVLREEQRRGLGAAERAKERMAKRMLEVADLLDADAGLPVPVRSISTTLEPAKPTWNPIARLRQWKRIRQAKDELITRLESRTETLEGQLRRVREETIERGRRLRAIWSDEAGRTSLREIVVPEVYDADAEAFLDSAPRRGFFVKDDARTSGAPRRTAVSGR